MNSNIHPSKQIELLERQKEMLLNIELDENAERNARIFKDTTTQLFEHFFKENHQWINELSELNFDPHTYSMQRNRELLTIRNFKHFKKCVEEADIILSSAISKIKLEQELSTISDVSNTIDQATLKDMNKVFIVHGHDDALKDKVARFIENLNLKAIILHEQSDRGQTIINKFEANSDVGFAIVLYTPCDVGRPIKLNAEGKEYPERNRARQNVIFEHGFFAAKLGLENVVALKKGDVEIPNDLSGVVYKEYDEGGSWKYQIARELDESGYEIDYKLIR